MNDAIACITFIAHEDLAILCTQPQKRAPFEESSILCTAAEMRERDRLEISNARFCVSALEITNDSDLPSFIAISSKAKKVFLCILQSGIKSLIGSLHIATNMKLGWLSKRFFSPVAPSLIPRYAFLKRATIWIGFTPEGGRRFYKN